MPDNINKIEGQEGRPMFPKIAAMLITSLQGHWHLCMADLILSDIV